MNNNINWSEFHEAVKTNFPDLHKEIVRNIGQEYFINRPVAIIYLDKFHDITGHNHYIYDCYAVINWALEMKKKNEMIEYVWLL